jgi:hypothetical protein
MERDGNPSATLRLSVIASGFGAGDSVELPPIDPVIAAKFYRERALKFLTYAGFAKSQFSREMYRRLAAADNRFALHAERDADEAKRDQGIRFALGMISERDAYRAAKLLIDQCGEEAVTYAAGRDNLLLVAGCKDAASAWHRILAAIEELQRGRRAGEAVN